MTVTRIQTDWFVNELSTNDTTIQENNVFIGKNLTILPCSDCGDIAFLQVFISLFPSTVVSNIPV